jgi:PAS domain S-box-containing protein
MTEPTSSPPPTGSNVPAQPAGTLAALLDTLARAPLGLLVLDERLHVVGINSALATFTGVSPARVSGLPVGEPLAEAWTTLEPMCARVRAGDPVANGELQLAAPAGTVGQIICQVSVNPVWHAGERVGLAILVNNVTGDRRREEALHARNALYAMLARTNQVVASAQDAESLFEQVCTIAVETGRFRFAWVGVPDLVADRVQLAASAGEDLGYLSRAVITLSDHDTRSFGPTGMAVRTGDAYVVNDFLGSPLTAPWRELGQKVGFRASAALPLRRHGVVVAVLTLYADVTDFFSERMLETLAELTSSIGVALERYELEAEHRRDVDALLMHDRALQALAQGIVISDPRLPDNPVVYASPSIETLTGYAPEEFIGRNCRFLQNGAADPASVAELRDAIRAGRAVTVELRNFRKDGTLFWNSLALSPVRDEAGTLTHFVGVQTDVTERRRLEDQLRQAQKMEALGQLAGGIAHDFNNLLTVINGSTEVALELVEGQQPFTELLEETQRAGERAAVLTRQLLTFSRRQVGETRVLDLRAVALDTERILRRLIGADVRLTMHVAADAWRIKADEGHVEQVLVNLAVNARDAMPKGGDLRVEIANVLPGETLPTDAASGDWVRIRVSDTGCGMDASVRAQIFEPFFTTKPEGKGTGLGLATVRSIVSRAGGLLLVESEVGVGSAFSVYFPRTRDDQSGAAVLAAADPLATGTETVLVAEDDAPVRDLMVQALRARGYVVLASGDGLEALAMAAAHAGPIHLIIADVVLPELGGADFAARVVGVRPDCKVLFLSGYAAQDLERYGVSPNQFAFLPKPFTPTLLLGKVRSVLDS